MKRLLVLLTLLATSCASLPSAPAPVRAHALRLAPGADLRESLEELVRARGIRAGYVATCAGSLSRAVIRYADRAEPSTLDGKFEIVSLTGTLSQDGPHLHIAISDGDGRTIGGHLAGGSLVYTTAEVVVIELTDVVFTREVDAGTGYKELVIKPAK